MRSMNPDAPNFVDASAAAARYANFINEPKYEVANNYFDTLKKEKLANDLKEEEFRRYNQEFGLKQAAANREQSKYDRELNTDKALLDYQNIIRGTSQGGILNNNEGMSLANEYQKLVGTVGEEKAAETINAKAQMLAQLDAKKAQSDPFYAANKIQGLTINGDRYGSIDPTKLINMQTGIVNDFVNRGESLRTHTADQAYKNKSLALDAERLKQQQAQYNLQNKRYDVELENKTKEQLLKEQNMNTYIQQMIALGKDPRGYTYEQMKSIVDKAGETKDFGFEEKVFNTGKKDEKGQEITETKTVLSATDKPVSAKDIAKKEQENFDSYTKLLGSKQFIDIAGADYNSKAAEIVDIARRAKIPANIIENILANKTAENASDWFKGSLKYDDFNKFRVQDPNNEKKWTSLGEFLQQLEENPQFMEQVASGVTAPNLIQISEQQVAEEIAKQKQENDNFNPYRGR